MAQGSALFKKTTMEALILLIIAIVVLIVYIKVVNRWL